MPYRVRTDGTVECDSAREALDLQALYAECSQQDFGCKEPKTPKKGSPKAEDKPNYQGFWDSLNPTGRKVLKFVGEHQGAIKSDELADKLGIKTIDMPGVMIHVRKTAEKNGIAEGIVRGRLIEGRRPISTYQLPDAVRAALGQQLGIIKP